MSGKYALYLPFKIYNATINTATDAEFGAFTRALFKYDIDGTEPVFGDRAFSMLFESVRPEIDFNHKKYDTTVEKRKEAGTNGGSSKSEKKQEAARENGKLGGAPLGNQNAANKEEPPNQDSEQSEKQPKQMFGLNMNEKTTQAESESVISKQITDNYLPENPMQTSDQPPTAVAVVHKEVIPTSKIKGKKQELSEKQKPLFHAARLCFEANEKSKAILYQDNQTTAREMSHIKTLVIRCTNIAPDMSADFLKNVIEHFQIMTNGKLKGKAVFTPRALITPWIWELVIDSLPENESPELKEFVRGLFK